MELDGEPILTIVVLCFNDSAYVEQCLESIRTADGLEGFEVLIVDNGSTDSSADVMANFLDRTGMDWRVLTLAPNRGPCGGWNAGISAARGKYIAAVAADDFFDPLRFLGPVRRLEELDDSVVMAGCSVQWVNSVGDPVGALVTVPACVAPTEIIDLVFSGGLPKAVARVYRTERLRQLGGFDERFPVEDAPLDWRFSIDPTARAVWVPEGIVFYRQHDAAFTSALSISLNARLAVLVAEDLLEAVEESHRVVTELRLRAARFSALIPYEQLLFAASEQAPGWRLHLILGALRGRLTLRHRIAFARFAILPARFSAGRYRRAWTPQGFYSDPAASE